MSFTTMPARGIAEATPGVRAGDSTPRGLIQNVAVLRAVPIGAESDCMPDWREGVNVNPTICHGKACIRASCVMISVILDNIAAGIGRAEILPASLPERRFGDSS